MEKTHISCLDGLRGLAALWVLIGHAHILTGFRVPLIGNPDIGVDLFIILSGFLMVFHYRIREAREPWEASSTWRSFWIRRFFRIAPLYYAMLFVAIALGPLMYDFRMLIDSFNAVPPQPADRYLDQSALNFAAHLSFVFGAIPEFSYRTALPDWSIGLEMQFYLALPFIMIFIKRAGLFSGIMIVCCFSLTVAAISYGLGYTFPMPSFLPLKMHVFSVGILAASVLGADSSRIRWAAAIAMMLILLPIGGATDLGHAIARTVIAASFFLLVHHHTISGRLSNLLSKVSDFLGNKFFHALGELSFGVYLVHLMIMQPVVAYLIQNYQMSDQVRWAATLAITIPSSYFIAAIGYRLIEMPGQKFGKLLTVKRLAAAE